MLTYLAIPYSDPDPAVRHWRAQQADAAFAVLTNQGRLVYSPISMTHYIAVNHKLPTDFAFWERHCYAVLSACSSLVVLMLPGHLESIGVRNEVAMANRMELAVTYMEWPA